MGDAYVVAGRQHFVTGLEAGIRAGGDPPGQIDATDAGEAANNAACSGRCQGVLVVDTGVGDGDGDFARVKLCFVHIDKAADNLAFFLIDQVSLETHYSLLEFAPGLCRIH
jgi:hypothetical protein